jgi:hypothetical protein
MVLLASALACGCGAARKKASEPADECASLDRRAPAFLEAAIAGSPGPFFLPGDLLLSALDCPDPSPFLRGTGEKQERLASSLAGLGDPEGYALVPDEEDRKRFEPGEFIFNCSVTRSISVRDVHLSPLDGGKFFLTMHFTRIGDEGCWYVAGF